MGWNTRRSRLRKIKDHLLNVGRPVAAAEDSENARAIEREIAVAELGAAACLVSACGFDVSDTAAGFTKLHAFPRAEWPALFDEARAGIRRTSSERDTPRRLAALDALIEALQRAD